MNDEEQAGSDDSGAPSAEQSKKAPVRYVSPLERKAPTYAARALQSLFPPRTPRAQLVAFFADRAAVDTVRCWRSGKHNPPAWALDMIAAHGRAIARCAELAAPGNSAAIGTQNLLRSHAERRARRAEKAERRD